MNEKSDKRYLVLDIETVTDWSLVRDVFQLGPDATQEEMREKLLAKYSSGFAPPPFHIPICIALIDVDWETCKIQNAAVLEHNDEKTLLQKFWNATKLRKGKEPVKTVYVHFNGRGFDLPVLFLRSLKHRIPVPSWDRNRFAGDSLDICDQLSDFGATSKSSLNVVAKMLGLPGKTDIDGSQIEELFNRGERTRIKDYCMDDALTTYYIWLTLRLVRGEISQDKYREAFDSAAEIVRSSRPITDDYFSS